MKRFLLFAAAAALVLSSCIKNEPIDTDYGTQAIGFSTYTSQATRGADANIGTIKGEGYDFGVLAAVGESTGYASQAPEFMYNQKVFWTGATDTGHWEYAPVKYWPEANATGQLQTVTFWAYAPFNDIDETNGTIALSTMTTTGAPKLTYTAVADAANQTDLLAATAYNQTRTSATAGVQFDFKHILSRISFSAKLSADDANNTFTINSINVTYKDNAVDKMAVFAYNNTAVGVWEADGRAQFGTTELAAGNVVTMVTADRVVTTTAKTVSDADMNLMLIPQDLAKGDIHVAVNYTTANTATESGNGTSTSTAQIDLPAITLAQGKAYNFLLIFTPSGIDFSNASTVSNWGDTETIDTPDTYQAATVAAANTYLSNFSNLDMSVNLTTQVSTDETITVPATSIANKTVTISVANGIASGQTLTITQPETIDVGTAQSANIVLNIPGATAGANLVINAPTAHVVLNGVEINNVTAATSGTTFVVGEGTTIETLTLKQGKVEINGTVNSIVLGTDVTTGDVVIGEKGVLKQAVSGITVTGHAVEATTGETKSYFGNLPAAIAAAPTSASTATAMTLQKDIDLGGVENAITIDGGRNINLNMNGNSITNVRKVFIVKQSSLEISGTGTISATDTAPNSNVAIYVFGTDQVVEGYPYKIKIGANVTIVGQGYGIAVMQVQNKAHGVQIDLHGKLHTNYNLCVLGTVTDTSVYPKIIVHSGAECVGGDATDSNGIYAAGFAEWEIQTNTKISGIGYGLGIKSGTVTISGGDISSNGDKIDPSLFSNGMMPTGSALQIEGNTDYPYPIKLYINGGEFRSTNGYALLEYGEQRATEFTVVTTASFTSGADLAKYSVAEDFKTQFTSALANIQ